MFASYNPPPKLSCERMLTGFGLFPFRSPLLRVSRESRSIGTNIRANRTQLILFSFPPGTEMFHFPGFALHGCYPMSIPLKAGWISPFGHLRIKGYKPPPRSFSQVSRVLHSHPRPRHPPCTLSVSRTELCIPQSLICTLNFPCGGEPQGFQLPMRIRMKKIRES